MPDYHESGGWWGNGPLSFSEVVGIGHSGPEEGKLSWSGHTLYVEIATIYMVLPMREELLHTVQSTLCEARAF